jgi:lipopolysaccharide biosynthesis regulator YciM
MDRDAQHNAARRNAWETATSVQERIHKLAQVAADYPESMTTFADIAASYLAMDDHDNARRTYQHIVDHQRQFAHLWANELGKAYLFTHDAEKAIATLEQSAVISYDQGLFLAFAYLKHGEQQKCATQFQRWIEEALTRAFAQYAYDKYIKALFNAEEAQYIDDLGNRYHEKYENMEPYQFYCALYKQYYVQPGFDTDDFDDEDFEIPPKLSKATFETLTAEYCVFR